MQYEEENMKDIVVYVHGKGGSAAEAGHYIPLFPDSEVIGFDYRAHDPWEAAEEFPRFFPSTQIHLSWSGTMQVYTCVS